MITEDDRKNRKYKYCTEDTIYGMKVIEGLTAKTLWAIVKEHQSKKSRMGIVTLALLTLLGKDTNPNWIIARVAEEMYDRDMIDEKLLDELGK